MLLVVIGIGILFIILERILPDQKLPEVKGWWLRVVFINILQLGVIFLGMYTWDLWFQEYRIFELEKHLHPVAGGFLGYFIITFIFYWWHKFRHDINLFWLLFHQVHHSPQRIETITSFYKHPLEILFNSLIIGLTNHVLLGIGIEASAWTLLFTATAEYFYHMNIKTPHWVGYFIQRPEMHRIHHEKGKHYNNFADLPVWDMLFGTYKNPKESKELCGFVPDREVQLGSMLLFKNVNKPYKKK